MVNNNLPTFVLHFVYLIAKLLQEGTQNFMS
jgi:hypothetical protein